MDKIEKMSNMLDGTKWGQEFERSEIDIIARYLNVQTFEPGEYIFRQGERQNFMAFIVSGKIEIIKESADSLEIIVVSLLPRTCFGEMSFVDDEPRSASAVVKEHSTLLFFSTNNFERLSDEHPKLGMKIIKNVAKTISQRLRMTTGKLVYTRT